MQEPKIDNSKLISELGAIALVFVFCVLVVGILDYLGLIS
jgi:hypothetical protein